MKLEPLAPTPKPTSGDPKLDRLLAALDAPHDDAKAHAAIAEIYDLDLRARLAQVIGGVRPTEMSALVEKSSGKPVGGKASAMKRTRT